MAKRIALFCMIAVLRALNCKDERDDDVFIIVIV